MSRLPSLVFALALGTLAMTSNAQDTAAPAAADTFEREVLKSLKEAHGAKRSVTVHVGGTQISGLVKAIGPDVIVLANQSRSTIMVRRERIDAVEAN